MKIIIEKQFNKIGESYQNNKNIEAEVRMVGEYFILETEDGDKYFIPVELFEGILNKLNN